ncbi:heterokaryon incompatibility protein-domain-containing protein [Annulohypoxylon truncatum]|uniref:heterokaryon incompatibility protein-domain-containing protein n=1 Tax=Annulohypoxylon truncatum TaxID=327061 RepID=UPI00200758E3|nr:heterokaryon incompatibility protein-domain-containing protein [Annulohypoxylon truncatum]KAI1206855.1 heterokaryon incompatibility protein-domain-containing protein [Annulohypoxylon truncatum]
MIDDTCYSRHPSPGTEIPGIQYDNISQDIPRILENSFVRKDARFWATSLRFLTYDDGDDSLDAVTTSNTVSNSREDQKAPLHGQCLPCKNKVTIPPGHICGNHMIMRGDIPNREAELHKHRDPCVHVRENSCNDCQNIPLFPNEGKVTKFRIRRVYQPGNTQKYRCHHFVAVSYCWSNEPTAEGEEKYRVVDEDKKERYMRASNATIDRCVAFARENGFRMIWIDQECINQDDTEEKQLAIQSMDYVYMAARTCIGLFRAELPQKHLDCLREIHKTCNYFRGSRGPSTDNQMSPFLPKALTGTIQELSTGRKFFTNREIFASRQIIADTVSTIVNDRWNSRAWILQEAFISTFNMILLFPRVSGVNVRGSLLICHELAQSDIAITLEAMRQCLCSLPVRLVLEKMIEDERRGESSYDSADVLPITMRRLQFFYPPAELRELQNVEDKIAIVANICGYYFRLNTTEVAMTHNSLATCILALSLANNDFSLLIPQLYHFPGSNFLKFPQDENSPFSWAHSFVRNFQYLHSADGNPFGATAVQDTPLLVSVSSRGLWLEGFLWRVDKFISLTPLQTKYAEAWRKLANDKTSSSNIVKENTVKLATTHLLFEIIMYLVAIKEKDVANSILHSTLSLEWSRRNIESVDQLPSGLKIENRKEMFSLDRSPDGKYYQCWIIDRVMEKGGFWVGRLVNPPPVELDEPRNPTGVNTSPSMELDEPSNPTEISIPLIMNLFNMLGYSKILKVSSERRTSSSRDRERVGSGHIGILRVLSFLTMIGEGFEAEGKFFEFDEWVIPDISNTELRLLLTPPTLARLFCPVFAAGAGGSSEKSASREAIFDIDGTPDGETLVLTPLQTILESIPRPAMRAMSVSWVVDMVYQGNGDTEKTKVRVKDKVQGMWEHAILNAEKIEIV